MRSRRQCEAPRGALRARAPDPIWRETLGRGSGKMATVDVWVAIFDVGTQDQTVVGVYTSEERALAAARRVSPESAEAVHWSLTRFRTG